MSNDYQTLTDIVAISEGGECLELRQVDENGKTWSIEFCAIGRSEPWPPNADPVRLSFKQRMRLLRENGRHELAEHMELVEEKGRKKFLNKMGYDS